eukprot:4316351-Pyramimonas_sp.AAC.1
MKWARWVRVGGSASAGAFGGARERDGALAWRGGRAQAETLERWVESLVGPRRARGGARKWARWTRAGGNAEALGGAPYGATR